MFRKPENLSVSAAKPMKTWLEEIDESTNSGRYSDALDKCNSALTQLASAPEYTDKEFSRYTEVLRDKVVIIKTKSSLSEELVLESRSEESSSPSQYVKY